MKLVNCYKLLTIIVKSSIIDVWQSPKYASGKLSLGVSRKYLNYGTDCEKVIPTTYLDFE